MYKVNSTNIVNVFLFCFVCFLVIQLVSALLLVPSTTHVSQRQGSVSVNQVLWGGSVTGAFLQPTVSPTVKVTFAIENPAFSSYHPHFYCKVLQDVLLCVVS